MMRLFSFRKTVKFLMLICIVLLVSSCSPSQKTQELVSADQNLIKLSPRQEFISALEANIAALQLYWSDSDRAIDQGLTKFVTSVKVDSDSNFSIVKITAEAETNTDEPSGKSMLFDKNLSIKVFCTGNTFTRFYQDTFNEILGSAFTFGPRNMSILELPSRGVEVRMVWNQYSTSTDEFGTEITKRKLIGTDEIGVSTSNLKKVTDPMAADYRKLSDLIAAKYAKQSWHDGRCARDQYAYNN